MKRYLTWRRVIFVCFLLFLCFLPRLVSEYNLNLATTMLIYSLLAVGFNIIFGQAGLLSFGHSAFFGIGAYVSAITTTHFALPFAGSVVVGILVAAVSSAIVFSLTIRLRDDSFAVASLCVQMMGFSVFNNWLGVTRGPLGIANIPRAKILGWHITSSLSHLGHFLLSRLEVFSKKANSN